MSKDEKFYYEYDPSQGGAWWRKEPPARDLEFEKELEKFGGLSSTGQPILRVKWAGTLLSDVSATDTLKYKQTWEGITHYVYTNDDGKEVKILRESDAPKGKIVSAVSQVIELGRLRWVIECHQSAEDAVRSGRFDMSLKDADGKPLFRTPPPEGVYNAFFWIQSIDGGYRRLDRGILDAVKQMWHYNISRTPEQKSADLRRDQRMAAKDASARAANSWAAAPDKSIIESAVADRRLEREFWIDMERRSRSKTF